MKGAFPELQPSLEANQSKALGVPRVCTADSKQVQLQVQVGRAWVWPQPCWHLSALCDHHRPGVGGWDTALRHSFTHRVCVTPRSAGQ